MNINFASSIRRLNIWKINNIGQFITTNLIVLWYVLDFIGYTDKT